MNPWSIVPRVEALMVRSRGIDWAASIDHRGYVGLRGIAIAPLVLCACNDAPSTAELATQRAATRAENARRATHTIDDAATWTLAIDDCAVRTLSIAQLRALPSVEVRVPNVDRRDRGGAVLVYRGVALSQLLAGCDVPPDALELTVVSSDGYRSTIRTADALRARIALAYDRDGQPIPRNEGGPLLLVFPSLDDP